VNGVGGEVLFDDPLDLVVRVVEVLGRLDVDETDLIGDLAEEPFDGNHLLLEDLALGLLLLREVVLNN